ncbi:MAG: hypothetical protein JXA94_05345 [Parachlamydiales bacterium]|nr:hypothetical protein [Parachlamydiales bacterium]
MSKNIKLKNQEIEKFHLNGKIALLLQKKLKTQKELSIAYTPGVSVICKKIYENPESVYDLTSKSNSVAIVTDGTAVLGLGNIGPKASIPVMEGKCMLFKSFANIDAWPVILDKVSDNFGKTDPKKFIETVERIATSYGGINLEDIAAPHCFEIEDTLDEILDIPVFHDDQWGTAIITLAACKNYLLITGKNRSDIKVVINGAGAAGIRIADMLKADGIKNITLCDSKGVISKNRNDLNPHKLKHAIETKDLSLKDAIKNADVFIGVSVKDAIDQNMVLSMNEYPAIFAMANPDPEITPELVKECMGNRKYIMATGRSDYPNQINNVLGFPFIFRGALNVRATKITMNMKIKAAEALSKLAQEKNIPDVVKKVYKKDFVFGNDYLIPTPFDPRINEFESKAVALAAIKDGVARKKLTL